jgi:hypothetical protein
VLKQRRRNLETFDSGQYGDGWCDEGIAIEQRGPNNSKDQDDSAGPPKSALSERHQCERTAFSSVMHSQQDQYIFGGDYDHQRPKNQRKNAQHRLGVDYASLSANRRKQSFAECLKRARANVAIDHPK